MSIQIEAQETAVTGPRSRRYEVEIGGPACGIFVAQPASPMIHEILHQVYLLSKKKYSANRLKV